MVSQFTNNKSWRFVEATYQFDDIAPLNDNFTEVVSIPQVVDDKVIDFTAIKIGDVDGSVVTNVANSAESINNNKVLTLNIDDVLLKVGDNYTVNFETNTFNNLLGYQLSLQFEDMAIEVVNSSLGDKNNFGLTQQKNGLITTSWNQTATEMTDLPEIANLFQITINAQKDGRLSEMLSLTENPTPVEAYDTEGNKMDIQLVFNEALGEKPFELYQNEPNPFKQQTKIGFYLPGDSAIELIFRDEAGRVLRTIKEDRKAGYNTFDFDKKDFAKGLIFYQLDTKFGSQNRKMLRLE